MIQSRIESKLVAIWSLALLCTPCVMAQTSHDNHEVARPGPGQSRIEQLLMLPPCLQYHEPVQTGSLPGINTSGDSMCDTTFDIEELSVISEGYNIKGWLYLPRKTGMCSLVILANGGGGKVLWEWMSHHPRIKPSKIGVFGGSEGGRIAYLAAARYPLIQFTARYAGDITSNFDSRYHTTSRQIQLKNPGDSMLRVVMLLWKSCLRGMSLFGRKKHLETRLQRGAERTPPPSFTK